MNALKEVFSNRYVKIAGRTAFTAGIAFLLGAAGGAVYVGCFLAGLLYSYADRLIVKYGSAVSALKRDHLLQAAFVFLAVYLIAGIAFGISDLADTWASIAFAALMSCDYFRMKYAD